MLQLMFIMAGSISFTPCIQPHDVGKRFVVISNTFWDHLKEMVRETMVDQRGYCTGVKN